MYYEIYYDDQRKEIVSQIPPRSHRDGSFGFGEHMIPEDGMLSTWHFTTALNPQFVFTPQFHVKRLRNGLNIRGEFEDLQWKENARISFEDSILPYLIRVERKKELFDAVEVLVEDASISINEVKSICEKT